MKNIFKNKKGKYIPNRLNLTTRLDSLYGEEPNLRYLEDRIAKIKQVDTYTKTEIDNQHATIQSKIDNCAKKNESNTFTEYQAIKGNTAFVEFRDNSNTRKGYIGKSSSTSNDIELNSESNSLMLTANHHVILTPGSNYQARYNKTPTVNEEIANKAYVDSKTAANKTILDQHDNRINGNWNVITENKTNLNNLTDKVNTNTTKLNRLETSNNQNSDRINSLTTKVNTNISEIEKQVRKVTNLETNAAMKNVSNTFADNQIFNRNVTVKNNLNVTNNITTSVVEASNMSVTNVNKNSDNAVVNVKHLKDTINSYQFLQSGDYTSFNYQLKFNKKAISTPKYMFWYELANGQELKLSTNIQLKPNSKYMFYIHMKDMDSNNGVAELQHVPIYQREWITNSTNHIIKDLHLVNIFNGVTFVSWRDYYPGNEGLFNRRVTLVCYWVPLQ